MKESDGFKLIEKSESGIFWYDINPKIVGKEGVVEKATNTQGKFQYAVNGIPEKHAWYDEKQLELIE